MDLSFAGCGFLGMYHVGVVSCINHYVPHMVKRISGASAGALAACSLLCQLPLGKITSDTIHVAVTARKYRLGPFNPKFDVNAMLEERLTQILPRDAYIKCRGRLNISCTRMADGQNVILNEFNSNRELIQALLCSSFIPLFSGLNPPEYRGFRYVDGCYSDNLPIFDENTITVSPFSGQSDICPIDNTFYLKLMNLANTSIELSSKNMYRIVRVLWPPSPDILSDLCKQGFHDTLRFLTKRNLITCNRCLLVNSKTQMAEPEDKQAKPFLGDKGEDDFCSDCEKRRQDVHLDGLPEAVAKVLEEACTSMNKGFINWVLNHKSVRLLSLFMMPYGLTWDTFHVIFIKLLSMTPMLSLEVQKLIAGLKQYLYNILKKINNGRQRITAKFTWHVDVTELNFGGNNVPSIVCPSTTVSSLPSVKERRASMNFNITVDLENTAKHSGRPEVGSTLIPAIDADSQEVTTVNITNAARVSDPQMIEITSSPSEVEIVQVIRTHDSRVSYYYLDEQNQVTVADIYNQDEAKVSPGITSVSESPSPTLSGNYSGVPFVNGSTPKFTSESSISLHMDG